jgi:tRNA G18 (ribose-2'-O)-methylase SpoU
MITNAVDFFNEHKVKPVSEQRELVLAVWEINNPGNMGQIIRLGHNVGAKKVWFVNDEPTFSKLKIKKTAGFSFDQMDWEFTTTANFFALLQSDYDLVILETCSGSENIFTVELPEKAILLAGNESFGVPAEIIEKSNLKVHIPMPGNCKSMNISHALSVAAFEWYRQKAGV